MKKRRACMHESNLSIHVPLECHVAKAHVAKIRDPHRVTDNAVNAYIKETLLQFPEFSDATKIET
jgi:hypothetical protein